MNQSIKMLQIALIAAVLITAATSASAQTPLLVEDFNYAKGALLTDNGWTAHSAGGTNPIAAADPGLTYSGYPSSGIGRSASMTVSGEDDHKTFAVQTSGSVYAAFMVNVSAASADPLGGYFFHLGPDPISTTFRARVFAKRNDMDQISFGLSKALTTDGNIAFTPFSYSVNTTYLIVVKYTIVDGATNDTVTMYINPVLPGGEPGTATLTATDVTQSDIAPGTVALRQGATATSPTVNVDGIRIGTSWESVTAGGGPTISQHYVDFDGDGTTDPAVVRNIGGGQVRWFYRRSTDGVTSGADWGLATDTFIVNDFDGDNKTDIAVWRPLSTGQPSGNAFFYILRSSDSTIRIEDFGQAGDNPQVSGDYDGDGADDIAVYRAGTPSTWFYRGSSNNPGGAVSFVSWGQTGDFPAPGDYDGDGRNDFVVQRNNGGGQARFWMLQTTAGMDSIVFGTPNDVIVPGDYDGDGKTDLAVIRGIGGMINWFIRPSSTGMVSGGPTHVFGASATDFVTPGDYDGDGKTDPAIWRSSMDAGASAFWFSGSTLGVQVVSYGQQNDYPVANTKTF